MTEINETVINQAFDAYLKAFDDLAAQEDILEKMNSELDDYKEGSPKFAQATKEIDEFQRTVTVYQRAFRKAALELDRVRTLVEYLAV